MKKKLTLMCLALLTLLGGVVFAQSLRRANATITWDFSQDFTSNQEVTESPYNYRGLSLVMNLDGSNYIGKSGFRANGTSSSTNRYISYTPTYDGTLTVTYISNNGSANDRITAIGTSVSTFASADSKPETVLAFGFTEGYTEKTISAELTKGKTYYIYLANGGQTIKKLQYVYDASSAAEDGDFTYQAFKWDFSAFPATPEEYKSSAMNKAGYDYDGLICYMPYAESTKNDVTSPTDYITSAARFHGNGNSNANGRHLTYTPEYDGTMTVTYRSNNNSATDRITAVASSVKTFNKDNVDGNTIPSEVIAWGYTNGGTDQTFEAELVKGQKYYIYFANGGQTIREITFIARVPNEGGNGAEEEQAIVYDFAAAAAAGENPDNLNGSAANGQAFYAWEKADKTDSQRQDYKGYTNYTGTNLPAECHVWRRSDRINNNVKDGGLYCPNDREMVIDGIEAGQKVTIVYNAENATNKKMLWAVATGEGHRTTATIGNSESEAVSGETAIPSKAAIHIKDTECGYFAFKVMKGMVIQKITIETDNGELDEPACYSTLDFASLDAFDIPDELKNAIKGLTIVDDLSRVTVDVSESCDEETPNRYITDDNDVVQLEMNCGQLVFTAAEGTSLKKVTFNYAKWNEGNTATVPEIAAARRAEGEDGAEDGGEGGEEPIETGFTVDAEKSTAIWAGYAEKLVVDIAGQTAIKSIVIEIGEKNGEALVLDLASGADLGAVVANAYAVNPYLGSLTLNLEKDGKYTTSKPMYISKPFILNGAEGAEIDASSNNGPLIQLAEIPELGLNAAGAYEISEVTLKDVKITGIKNRLFYADRQQYLIKKLTVDNSVLHIDGFAPRAVFDFYYGGNTEELSIVNSTLWANPANTMLGGLLNTQSGQDVEELGGTSQKISIKNSTLYNIAYGKAPVLLRNYGQDWMTFEVKDNVIVNSGEKGQFLLGLDTDAKGKSTWDVSGNAFTFDGEDTGAAETLSAAIADAAIAGGASFTDAENGDFSLDIYSLAFDEGKGDPRWLTPGEGSLVLDVADGKDLGTEYAAAKGDGNPSKVLIRLAKGGKYTIGSTLAAAGSIVVKGDAAEPATITATELAAPFITLDGATQPAMNVDGTENANYKYVGKVQIANVKIDSLKQSLVRDAQKLLVEELTVANSVVDLEGAANIFDFNGKGYPATLSVANSTLWSKNGHTGYLLQTGGRVRDLDSNQAEMKQTVSVTNSTLYRISEGKQLNNLQGKGQKSLVFVLTNSVLYETGTSTGNEVRGWLGGQNSTNPSVTYANNSYWAGGAAVEGWTDASKQGSDQSGTAIAGEPLFKNAAEGDFLLALSCEANKQQAGDPRWVRIERSFLIQPADGSDLAAVLEAEYATLQPREYVGSTIVWLAEGGQYKAGKSITVYGNLFVQGNKATIDASALDGAVFQMSETPVADANSKGAYVIENFGIGDVTLKGVKSYVFYDNNVKYAFENFKVMNSVVELATAATTEAAFEFKAGGALNFSVSNSTVYQTGESNVTYFTKYNNSVVPDNAIADFEGPWSWSYTNNTFYKVASGQWHNGGRIAQKASLMDVTITDNIWVDCATSGGGILRRLFGGSKKTSDMNSAVVDHNTWMVDGQPEDASNYNKTDGVDLTTDPQFADAANGDFTIGAGTQQAEFQTGDPRWLVEYVPTGIGAVKEATAAEGEWYTLQGVRVDKPAKGVYLHNGRKVVIR